MIEISKDDILTRLRFDNPWWEPKTEVSVAHEDSPRRSYFARFHHRVTNRDLRRATILMGPRRVGKTVMVHHSIRALIDDAIDPRQILYVALDTPVYSGLALDRLVSYFLEIHGHRRDAPLFLYFDEIQYHRDWELHLKSLVDSYPEYRFIASGSAAAALRMKSNESGAGRFSDFFLPPLSFAEYLQFIKRENELVVAPEKEEEWFGTPDIEALNDEFVNYINFGGYPEVVFSPTIRRNPEQFIKNDIIDKVLLRDLPSLYGINDIQELNRLFTMLAYNTGNEVTLEGLSQSSGVAKNTIRRYLEYLEAAFLIIRIPRIDQNARRFKRAMSFKVYLNNPTMRTALFGHVDAEHPAMGALTETAIFSQWQHGRLSKLHYARWKGGEVDIVNLDPRDQKPLWAVEVKWSDRPHQVHRELDNFVYFAERHPQIKKPLLVTSRTVMDRDLEHRGVHFEFIPSALYAYTLATNSHRFVNLWDDAI
ncbi:MAG: ATP-binding protein [Planctomycetes bacterium]|nr:ATP-binding protein [Planctomycetota bacterium]